MVPPHYGLPPPFLLPAPRSALPLPPENTDSETAGNSPANATFYLPGGLWQNTPYRIPSSPSEDRHPLGVQYVLPFLINPFLLGITAATSSHMLVLETLNTINRTPSQGGMAELLVSLPYGVFGFEQVRSATLASPESIAPFQFLHLQGDGGTGFVVVEPQWVSLDYRIELEAHDCKSLGLESASEAKILNIAIVRADGSVTVNLKGPIVYNTRTLIGRQIVPVNAAELPVNHPVGN